MDDLRDFLDYDSITGGLTWKKRPSKAHQVGKAVGRLDRYGYLRLKFRGKTYQSHRVAWYLHYGVWPTQIDHINRVRNDNRILNLRETTTRGNALNKITNRRLPGAFPNPKSKINPWTSYVKVNGKRKYLGSFRTEQEAHNVYIRGKV